MPEANDPHPQPLFKGEGGARVAPDSVLTEQELLSRLRLNAVDWVRPDLLLRLLDVFGSAENILRSSPQRLSAEGWLPRETAVRVLETALGFDAQKEYEALIRMGGRLCVLGDARYPALLQSIPDPPWVVYVLGRACLEDSSRSVALVGTRRPTPYGLRMTRRLTEPLVRSGAATVSGLARGIDTEVHRATLAASGRTYAVLGCGLKVCYPPENRALLDRIVSEGGAVLSEFPLEARPLPAHFPRRNRIISGLALGTVVVEGDERSGALITARLALEQGREVFAVPGPADSAASRGPNLLLQQGAHLVLEAPDVLEVLPDGIFGREEKAKPGRISPEAPAQDLQPEQAEVFRRLGEAQSVEALVEALGWDIPRVSRVLFDLEVKDLVVSLPGNRYAQK